MDRQNVTVSLPREIVLRARHIAVEKGLSLSRLLSESIEGMVREDESRQRALRRVKQRLSRGYDLGTKGHVGVSREALHER